MNFKFSMYLLIFSIIFWIPRCYYLAYANIPGFQGDSFDYYGISYYFSKGIVPDLGVIPPLYPLLLALLSKINDSIRFVILFQIILTYFSYTFLLSSFKNIYLINKKGFFCFFVIITFISWDSVLLVSETYIMTESIYYSFSLIFLAIILNISNKKDVYLYTSLAIITFLLATTRSNGLMFYLFYVVILIYIVFNNRLQIKPIFLFSLVPFLILNLIWCSINYISTKTFFIGNPYRIKTVTQDHIAENLITSYSDNTSLIYDYNNHKLKFLDDDYSKNVPIKTGRLINYIFDIHENRRNFFNETINDRYLSYYKNKNFLSADFYNGKLLKYDSLDRVDIRIYSIKELGVDDYLDFDLTNNNLFLKIYSAYNFLYNLVFRNLIWYFLAVTLLVYRYIRFKKLDFYIITIFSIILVNIFVISFFHGRLISRYHYLFMVYLLAVNILLLFDQRKKNAI